MNPNLEKRIRALEDNQIGVTMSNNADINVLRSLQRALIANNLGVGTNSPGFSSMFEFVSVNKGVVFPNMTTTQRNAIVNPKSGMVIYNTTTAKLNVYTTAWEQITSV